MEVHNLLEELVFRTVNELCNEKEKSGDKSFCTSPQCRTDIACYVLNRMPPKYVSSSRGLAHLEIDTKENPQLLIDIVTHASEGIRRVSFNQRPFYGKDSTTEDFTANGPFFNFPAIKGRLFLGTTFEPVSQVKLGLYSQGELVNMTDSRWQNPYNLNENTPGTFLFWPHPEKAHMAGATKTFEFELKVEDDRFESFHHYFKIELSSEPEFKDLYKMNDYVLKDLYVLPK